MIKEAIAKLVKKEDLTAGQMNDVMEEIMTGEATDAQKAAFLTALAAKGETIDEITAAARVLRAHCEKFLNDMDVLEIVGTGGDGSNSINISTLASIIVSAAGIPVAKHGNRAASSKCGTADCLKPLVVTAAVPSLIPLVVNGFSGSFGIAFLLHVILTVSRSFSVALPVTPLLLKSTSIRWLSVPPDTRLKPLFKRPSASALALSIMFLA